RELLSARPPAFGAKVVEGDGARHLAEPCALGAPAGVEPVPEPQRALERLAGEVLGRRPVTGEPREVPVDVVEMGLGCLRERHLTRSTPPPGVLSHPARVQIAELPDLVCVRAALVLARDLEVRAEPLERGVGEEGA